MNKITCEICNGSDIIKQEEFFVCQTCGMKYSIEAMRKIVLQSSDGLNTTDSEMNDAGIKTESVQRTAEEELTEKEKHRSISKKAKRIIAILIPITFACIAFFLVFTELIYPKMKPDSTKAKEETTRQSKSTENKASSESGKDELQIEIEQIKKAKVGDTVCFGSFEQDGETSDGKEDLEWIVLSKDNEKALLISKYVIDGREYSKLYDYTDDIWDKCSLRTWLNGPFYDNAFSSDEQKMIATTEVSDNDYFFYYTTSDRIFILSAAEAKRYFIDNDSRLCLPTKLASNHGVFTSESNTTIDGYETASWWLRTPGNSDGHFSSVEWDGSISYNTEGFWEDAIGVRPVAWVYYNQDS